MKLNNEPSTGPDKCFHIFYSKDLHKKKKVYKEGVLTVTGNTARIFDEDGKMVCSFKNKEEVVVDEEYVVNSSIAVSIEKVGSVADFNAGTIFTKTQIVLPVKKKPAVALSKSLKEQDMTFTKCGLAIESKIYETLRPHQREGVEFMYLCVSGKKNSGLTGCILADFMGLGKTLQTLVLSYSMLRQKEIKKFVIVCPLTLLAVWEKETKKWLEDKIAPLVCYGDGVETTDIVKKFTSFEYRMLIISYETFYKNMDKISGKCDLIIFDEGHRMKNKKSKLLLKMKAFRCEKRILLTGTPIQNNLEELYTCISIINPRMFGSEPIFKNVFQKPILDGLAKNATKEQKQIGRQRTAELSRQLKQFSLRRTAQVLKKFLPCKTEYLVFLKLTTLQQNWYKAIVGVKSQEREDMFRTLTSLRKLFIHPSILKSSRINEGNVSDWLEDCRNEISYKIEFTKNLAQECVSKGEKCVVVSYYTETLDYIANILKQVNVGCTKLDGRQSVEERKQSLAKFEKDVPALLLSGKAGGTGLTLVCASKMIMIEPDWNPSNDSQVMGRIWRQGQEKQVEIFRLLTASTFEEKVLMRQKLKKTLSNNLIDDGEEYDTVDMDKMEHLFVENKQEIISFREDENQMHNFLTKHQELDNRLKGDHGILFIKSISSSDSESYLQGDEPVCQFGIPHGEDTDAAEAQFDMETGDDIEIQNLQKIAIPKKTLKPAITAKESKKEQEENKVKANDQNREETEESNTEADTAQQESGKHKSEVSVAQKMEGQREMIATINFKKEDIGSKNQVGLNLLRKIKK